MRLIGLFAAVTAVSIVQLYVAGPLGLAWGLNRHAVFLAAFIGGMLGVIALVAVGPGLVERVKAGVRRIFRRPPPEPAEVGVDDEPGRFDRLVERFGAPFLGIAGPITIGGWAAAVLGTARGIDRLQLIGWLALGQAAVTAAYVYSLAEITD